MKLDPGEGPERVLSLYGLRVATSLELPGWPAAEGADVQVSIVEEPAIPPNLEGARYTAVLAIAEGEIRLDVRGVGRYVASGGNRITIAPEEGARAEDVQLYLTGAMLGAILHMRGEFPLHASCVAIDGRALAFAAPSGEGKSTLVAALLARGATFVSDDVCVLTPCAGGGTGVWPGAPRLKLDDPAMAALDYGGARRSPAGGNRGKFTVPLVSSPAGGAPLPLERVYLLRSGDGGPARLERLSGLEAVSALMEEAYLLAFAAGLGLTERVFRTAAGLTRSLTVSRLTRPRGFEHLASVVDLVERDVRGG